MPQFSRRSQNRLAQCHPDLQRIFFHVIEDFDCTVLAGHRGKKAQNEAFRSGHSKLRYPQSKHNHNPALAVDVAPYPIDWQDTRRMAYFAGHVMAVAHILDVPLRWGGDWARDTRTDNNNFDDLVHFELMDGRG